MWGQETQEFKAKPGCTAKHIPQQFYPFLFDPSPSHKGFVGTRSKIFVFADVSVILKLF